MTNDSNTTKTDANDVFEAKVKQKDRAEYLIGKAPVSAKNCMEKAFFRKGTRSNAIKAQCLLCVGYDRDSVKHCTGYSCPLWAWRPFQPKISPDNIRKRKPI